MIASEARIAANRLNARKSTGPRTTEGKERSRCNAVKHGMTGQGIALGVEEAAAVEARVAAFEADYRPVTATGRALARRAAMLSVRLERSEAREAAAIARDVRAAEAAEAAEADFDEARAAEVEGLFASLADDPARAVRRLMRMPEGVDRMIAAWRDLRFDLMFGAGTRWKDGHGDLALLLAGRKPGAMGYSRLSALIAAWQRRYFDLLGPEDGAGLESKERAEWARRELAALFEANAASLEAHRATIDLDSIAADRAGAADLALFDPSREATLARKYEAAAGREMHRALKEMKAVEAEAAGLEKPAPPLASISPEAPTPPARPAPTPVAIPPAPRIGGEEASSFVPMTIGRAEKVPR